MLWYNLVALTHLKMFHKFISILLWILSVKGDLIEIEIETEQDNICPKLYRSDIFHDNVLSNDFKKRYKCYTSKDEDR